jgi:hypothetical protein
VVPFAAILTLSCVSLGLSAPPAAGASTKLTVATGSITCRKLTGTISFTPPMHSHVNQMETRVISLHASDCTTKKSNVAAVSSGNVTFTVHYEANG